MQEVVSLRRRREAAASWYSRYRQMVAEQGDIGAITGLTDKDINELVHELR